MIAEILAHSPRMSWPHTASGMFRLSRIVRLELERSEHAGRVSCRESFAAKPMDLSGLRPQVAIQSVNFPTRVMRAQCGERTPFMIPGSCGVVAAARASAGRISASRRICGRLISSPHYYPRPLANHCLRRALSTASSHVPIKIRAQAEKTKQVV
jgi:hypothetical protein